MTSTPRWEDEMTIEACATPEQLERDGFTVAKGVLTPEEVTRLRHDVTAALQRSGIPKSGGMVLPNAAAGVPDIQWVLTHPRILAAVRGVLGTHQLTFTLEADLHRNYIANNWHKDTGEQVIDGGYFGVPCFDQEHCRVVKVGLYLQDHQRGGGLNVRPGTQRDASLVSGQDFQTRTGAGDAILFDVRITHRGVAVTFMDRVLTTVARVIPARGRARVLDRLRHWWLAVTGRPDRLVVYFAFGVPSELTDAFATRNMRRQLSQLGETDVQLAPELADAFAKAEISVPRLRLEEPA